MVKRRYVFHIAGYDPIGAAWYRLFKRELAKFAQLWNVRPTLSDLERSTQEPNARWTVVTSAANWRVETVYEPLLWDDIVLSDFARPTRERLAKSSLAFLDIVLSGVVFRYFKANWQYALFFSLSLSVGMRVRARGCGRGVLGRKLGNACARSSHRRDRRARRDMHAHGHRI